MYGRVCIDSGLDFTTWPHGGSTSACGYVETSGAERCPTELKAIFDGIERPPQLTERPAPWDYNPGRPNLPSLAPRPALPPFKPHGRFKGVHKTPLVAAAARAHPRPLQKAHRHAGPVSYQNPTSAPSIPVHPCLDTTSHPEEFSSPSSYRGGSRGSREANRCRGDKDKAEARRRQQRRQ